MTCNPSIPLGLGNRSSRRPIDLGTDPWLRTCIAVQASGPTSPGSTRRSVELRLKWSTNWLPNNRESTEFRSTADALAEATLAGGDPTKLSAAWVYRLLYTPNQLLEKTTLFWHGHFATGAEKVKDARMMWNQNQLLREHALGNFGDLVHQISQDPAMLIYLDSAINRKAHPNENFARELMELFCLGEGNYSESDVLELARCFTGWEIKNKKFRKNRYQHDSDEKTVLQQSGDFDGEDGVRIVLEQPAAERFLARKLYRFFVSDEPESDGCDIATVGEFVSRA